MTCVYNKYYCYYYNYFIVIICQWITLLQLLLRANNAAGLLYQGCCWRTTVTVKTHFYSASPINYMYMKTTNQNSHTHTHTHTQTHTQERKTKPVWQGHHNSFRQLLLACSLKKYIKYKIWWSMGLNLSVAKDITFLAIFLVLLVFLSPLMWKPSHAQPYKPYKSYSDYGHHVHIVFSPCLGSW